MSRCYAEDPELGNMNHFLLNPAAIYYPRDKILGRRRYS